MYFETILYENPVITLNSQLASVDNHIPFCF